MLVLSRNEGQEICIAHPLGTITLTVVRLRGSRVQLSIRAHKQIDIWRPDAKKRKDAEPCPKK